MNNSFSRKVRAIARPVRVFENLESLKKSVDTISSLRVKVRKNEYGIGIIEPDGFMAYPAPPSDYETINDLFDWVERCFPDNERGYFIYVYNPYLL